MEEKKEGKSLTGERKRSRAKLGQKVDGERFTSQGNEKCERQYLGTKNREKEED